MDFSYEEQAEFSKLSEYYAKLEQFLKNNKKLTYMELDYAVVHDLTLFTVEPDFSFEALEEDINNIIKTIPAMKQIFAKPFIHLKEQNVILPTESVRIINNNTIQHISSHSELWSDVTKDEIKPIKLLTRTYEDNYGIYENLIFCKTVDEVLAFARNNLRILQELIYTNQTIEINLLERLNHLNYFLALGKLHTGYSRNFDSYYGVSMRCLNKLQFIMNTLVPRLKRPVYKNNKARPKNLKTRKTNILSMHRDYHQIYKLSKYFSLRHIGGVEEFEEVNLNALQKNYYHFCVILTIFSIGHFNFDCDKDKAILFSRLNMSFQFKAWKLNLKGIQTKKYSILSISFKKDTTYTILLIPTIFKDNEALIKTIMEEQIADEYICCNPFDFASSLEISMTSLESFRRIEQFLLKGMIYSDNKREDCPFCNHQLILNEESSMTNRPIYECLSCRTIIEYGYCSNSKKTYSYTKIAGLTKSRVEGDPWLRKRKLEAQMCFRNITKINEEMEIVCPYCNVVHSF
ncbi:MAG: hypothetical protein NC087_02565 [Anaeroplasma bactoclasticum]|nr:hypothetical protein [Anaeroplasma bactoclasticum]MCM1556399.1 hypothetical protein [Anaeroplasma bactoclasticum]